MESSSIVVLILALVNVPMFQGGLTVILIYVSILLHLSAGPYAEERNNLLEIVCLFCALVFVAFGMIFYPSLDQNQDCVGTSSLDPSCDVNIEIKAICSLVLVLLVVISFLLAVGITVWEVYERHLSRKASEYIWEHVLPVKRY